MIQGIDVSENQGCLPMSFWQEAVDKGMKIEDTTIGTEDAPKKPGPKKGKKPESTGSDEE